MKQDRTLLWQALCLLGVLIPALSVAIAQADGELVGSLGDVLDSVGLGEVGSLTDNLMDQIGNPLDEVVLDLLIEDGLLLEPTTGEILDDGIGDLVPTPDGDNLDLLE